MVGRKYLLAGDGCVLEVLLCKIRASYLLPHPAYLLLYMLFEFVEVIFDTIFVFLGCDQKQY